MRGLEPLSGSDASIHGANKETRIKLKNIIET